jgi:hypothetical protein
MASAEEFKKADIMTWERKNKANDDGIKWTFQDFHQIRDGILLSLRRNRQKKTIADKTVNSLLQERHRLDVKETSQKIRRLKADLQHAEGYLRFLQTTGPRQQHQL